MDLRQLKYFRAIVDAGHISGAAQQLFMTQPSLSQQLKQLEAELEVKLLERGSRKVSLTPAGSLLYERSGQILALLDNTAAEIKELHDGTAGQLSIGSIVTAGVTLLPNLLQAFHCRYPKVKINLREGDTHSILELLENGVIEIGIVRNIFSADRFHLHKLPPEPMIVAGAARWQSLLQSPLPLSQLDGLPLLVLRTNEALITQCCLEQGFTPTVLCTGDDVRSLLVWANEGFGLALVPRSALGLIPGNSLTYTELQHTPLTVSKVVIWSKQRQLSTAARHFLNMLVE